MKIRKIVTGLVIILSIVFAALVSLSNPHQILPARIITPEPPPALEELIPEGKRADNEMPIRVLFGEEIIEMSMERYLIGVVAAEMPVSFESGALMAQAVAVRTNVLYNMNVNYEPNHPDADACTSYSCCSAYIDDETLRKQWSDDYVENIKKVIDAVLRTDGEYISYENRPIQALFHSSSIGKTETSGNVWMTDLPYLHSVYSPETYENVPDYVSSVTIPQQEFIDTIQKEYPNAIFSGDVESWITDTTYTESGRVNTQIIGGVLIKGTKLRSMFNLRSAAISFEFADGNIIFTTIGYGHGVGMSQYGANVMAKDGMDYKDILCAYYIGTTIAKVIIENTLQDSH